MNKNDLIQFVRDELKCTKAESENAINAVFKGITESLEKGDGASFVGFGSFAIAERSARKGRNPRTGEVINIPASRFVKFKPGKNMKERVA